MFSSVRRRIKAALGPAPEGWPVWTSFEPDLLAPSALMQAEGISNLEAWFRWSEEWSMLLRVHGHIATHSNVLEIGCGVGRIAFPLRYVLTDGSYDGFDIRLEPVEFLQRNFTPKYPNFRFHYADLHNTYYNDAGKQVVGEYRAPVADASIDIVYAASIFTHMLPANTLHYVKEAGRVLRPGGRCVFSFFLLGNYRPGQPRPGSFASSAFDFAHHLDEFGEDFALVEPTDPERMTAYRLSLIERFAQAAGLEIRGEPLPGMWSGSFMAPLSTQDIVVLGKPAAG